MTYITSKKFIRSNKTNFIYDHINKKKVTYHLFEKLIFQSQSNFKSKNLFNKTVILSTENPLKFLIYFFALLNLKNKLIIVSKEENCKKIIFSNKLNVDFIIKKRCVANKVKFKKDSTSLKNNSIGLLTSGTTSGKKICVLKIKGLIKRLKINNHIIDEDIHNSLCFMDLSFGHGLIGNTLTFLKRGSNIHLNSFIGILQDKNFFNKNKIDFFSSTPSHWKILINQINKFDMKNVQRVHIGSEYIDESLKKKIIHKYTYTKFYNLLGMTEMCNWFAIGDLKNNYFDTNNIPEQIFILENNKLKKYGKGILILNNSDYFDEYINHKSTKIKKLFKTNDICQIDKNGHLKYYGRDNKIFKRFGKFLNLYNFENQFKFYLKTNVFINCKLNKNLIIQIDLFIEKKENIINKINKIINLELKPDNVYLVPEIYISNRGKVDVLRIYKNINEYEKL